MLTIDSKSFNRGTVGKLQAVKFGTNGCKFLSTWTYAMQSGDHPSIRSSFSIGFRLT